jgi:hypothetical protein
MGGKDVVVAIRPRHRAQGRCSCGWVGRPRILLSSAKVDALIHTARGDCQPAVPMVQPEACEALKPPGILTVACPAGCGEVFLVPIVISDVLSVSTEDGEPSTRFAAEAPELHDHVFRHLKTCPSASSWLRSASWGRATASRTG